MSKFKNVLITGASSGLGRALAIELSKKSQNLFLCARNFENLQETKNLCQNSNANIYLKILDVKDEIASRNYIAEIEENFALDLIIANAGISGGTALGTESFAQVKEIFDTNIYGVLNIIQPAIEKMKLRKAEWLHGSSVCSSSGEFSSLAVLHMKQPSGTCSICCTESG